MVDPETTVTAARGREALPHRVDRATVVAVGTSAFYLAMTVYASLVFQQFTVLQVVSVALCFAALFAGLLALLSPDVRRMRLRPTPLSMTLGFIMVVVLLVVAFTWTITPGPIWSEYFPSFPNVQLGQGSGFHQDAVFHVSLIQSILDFGYPSTSQNGVPFVPYHVLSHYTDAAVLRVTGLEPYDSYGLFFHFKVTLFLMAIVTSIWTWTRKLGRLTFLGCLVFLTPVLLSTWIGVGSHALWLTSLIIILSAKHVFEIVLNGPNGWKQYLFLFLVGAAVGLGKVSSGLMFVVFVGSLVWLRNPRLRGPYLLIGGWLVFYGIYWRLFDSGYGSGGGLQRPSVRGTLGFLFFPRTYGGNPVEWNLGALYMLVALLGIFAWVFRNRDTVRFLIGTVVGIAALTAVTQLLAGLTQPDLFYFIYGLLVPVTVLGVQQLLADLAKEPRLPARMRRLRPVVVRSGLVALLVVSTWPVDKPPVNAFTVASGAVGDSVAAANSSYFDQYNLHRGADDQASLSSIISGRHTVSFGEPGDDAVMVFRNELRSLMEREELTSRDTLLFVPKEVFDSDIAELGGPSWARGMLLYALVGVPLLHGIEDASMRGFGQVSYGPDALQQSLADFDVADACSHGKQVIVVRSWDDPEFELACPVA